MTRVYAIFDSKAEAYSQPIFSPNNATAIRAFAKAANQEGHDFKTFAGDYTLFCVAEWDEITGRFLPLDAHENLGLAIHYVNLKPANQL